MDEEAILNFVSITGANPQKAAQYMRLADNNLEQAIQLFFDSPNLDVGDGPAPTNTTAPSNSENPITVDSDEEMSDFDVGAQAHSRRSDVEDDEAMARRLQEEMYGQPEQVRAPMARTTETLVGPGSNWGPGDEDEDVEARVQEQLRRRAANRGRAGIFNQQGTRASVWDAGSDDASRRRELATATGGASESSSKSNMLAQMYRPPFELMYQSSWDKARDDGKEKEKWLLVNIQDPAIFDCQILNRDIWKNEDIQATVRENFIFMQYNKDDPRGAQYVNYYFQNRDSQDAYPHIAIVDPRTGEQMKIWSGPPTPPAVEFHAQLHEFLDRYSLKVNAKNPVATRKPERSKVDVNRMTEEEMLEMALQASLDNSKGPKDDDPDALTKESSSNEKGKAKVEEEPADLEQPEVNGSSADIRFMQISSTSPYTEPDAAAPSTRIQFKSTDGKRVVKKFKLDDSVSRLYEWIKAGGWEGKEGAEFDLVFLKQNLIDSLDKTISEAGLRNAALNLEFAE